VAVEVLAAAGDFGRAAFDILYSIETNFFLKRIRFFHQAKFVAAECGDQRVRDHALPGPAAAALCMRLRR
jgi:hypothetical protein